MSNSVNLERLKWCTAVVALVVAVVGVVKLYFDVQEIHVMVNSRMSEAQAHIKVLRKALNDAGIEVPDAPEREE